VATLVIDAFYCFTKLKIRFSFKNLQFSLLKQIWVFTFFIFLNQIIDQINWSVSKFLLGRLISTAAVAVYGMGAQINTMFTQFSTAVSSVFVPQVNREIERNCGNKGLTALFTKVGRVQFIILALILSGFIFFGKPFMRFWANELDNPDVAYYLAIVLIASVFIPLIQNLGIEIQRAKNMHKTRSVVYFCIAVVNIIVSIPLIKSFGVIGAAIGTAGALLIGNVIFMNWYYHSRIGLDMFYFWKQIIKFIPALIVPCVFGVLINCFIKIDGIFVMLLFIVVYTLIYCASMWLLGMNKNEKQMITNMVEKIFSRR
jgi:O-antigen/teichoic acid export membrane protein